MLEEYIGLRGQERIAFVDRVGRAFHHDRAEVAPWWGWQGSFRLKNFIPEWAETIRRYLPTGPNR